MFAIWTQITSLEPYKEECYINIAYVALLLSLHVKLCWETLQDYFYHLMLLFFKKKKKQALIVKYVFWINKFESKSRYTYCTEVSYFSHSNSLFPLQAKSRERVRDLMQFLVCAVQTSDIITSSVQPLL